MYNFLRLENRHNGEVLLIRRMLDAEGQVILALDGTLPPGTNGPPLHVHFREHEEGIVKAGTLGAQVGTEKIVGTYRGNRNPAERRSPQMVERGRRSA